MRSALLVILAMAAATVLADAQQAPQLGRDDTLARFFAPTTPPLVSYHATRRLNASTRGGKMTASLVAETSLDPSAGFVYRIVSEDGSSLIRHRVLVAALDAEQKAVRGGDSRQAALT